MRVSAIVPVYNGAATLGAAIRALQRSTHPPHEIIVVDDGSSDGSAAVARAHGAKLVSLGANGGVGRARNAGAKASEGDVLFFTDADVEVRPDTIQIGVSVLEADPGIDALVGMYTEADCYPNLASSFKNLTYHFVHRNSSARFAWFIGNCGLIRRASFEGISGFDEASEAKWILEDVDLGCRLRAAGGQIALEKRMQVAHKKRFSILSLAHSDAFKRAAPWCRLILRRGHISLDNCTSMSAGLSLLLTWVAVFGAVGGLLGSAPALLVGGLALLGFLWNERALLRYLVARRGLGFGIASVPLRVLYFLSAGVGSVWGLMQWTLSSRVRS
jgi:glycosyltransferase involved in cell wall biosynthesis